MKSYLPAALFGSILTAAAITFGGAAAHAAPAYAQSSSPTVVAATAR